ncbi:MAG: LLM class flavin-dependent oxidoreductase [Actinomycetota bacterium]|nr:LLM class flavin-dependent oxidoreductase [Actinomycetota bacterium]
MRFGIFLQPVHHPSEPPTLALESDLELLVHLDRLGYDEAWIGEHHSTGWENIGSPEVFIAAAAQRTKRIKLGTGVVQLGLHNPLVLLDRMILLDHLTRGRAMFGVGVGGGLPSDLALFGLSAEDAGRRLDQSLDTMLKLLDADGPVSVKTDWFELKDAVLQLGPFSEPHMQFAVASMNPKNVELMGRLGGQVLLGPVPDWVPEIFEHLQRGAEAVGREASRDQIVLSYRMHIDEDRESAIEAFKAGSITEHYDFDIAVNGRRRPGGTREKWYEGFVDEMFIGSVEDAIEMIEWIQEASGGVGGILFQPRDWAGQEAKLRSFELFAKQVAPRFQGHADQQSIAGSAAGPINGA